MKNLQWQQCTIVTISAVLSSSFSETSEIKCSVDVYFVIAGHYLVGIVHLLPPDLQATVCQRLSHRASTEMTLR